MILRFVIILLITCANKISFSQDWIYVGSSVKGDKYYLRNTRVNEYGSKKVWSKIVAKSMTYIKGNKTYTLIDGYCLQLKEYDCSSRQYKFVSVAYYNSKGVPVSSHNYNDFLTEWEDVVPESVGEMLLDKACELF